MHMQVKTIKEHYENMMEEIESIHNDYKIENEKYADYFFGCTVKALENTYYDVKKCSFLVGSEAFVDIARIVKDLKLFRL